ncbi:uracil-xanthine permease family protein [Thermosediminibacter litoriperuensis]|uniref:Uracil permease n=1 Tax=Thermosediminibacter litoriperuensis TaxID=291989 RepID=A0A5S5ADI5_9FIRM|nr:solute carrier family 23 protein [Thermosediminibacter litoriperuensis]TYP47432.1 uracil permease [Thermosediminibacter litoriperuensis]
MAIPEKEVRAVERGPIRAGDYLPFYQLLILGLQHTFTMFGATVLVPILTGFDVGVSLLTAGISTLWFHFVTRGRVPVFLGSSFAFIAPLAIVVQKYGVADSLSGVIAGGLLYVVMSFFIYKLGPDFIEKIFPPIVTGPIIMVIGLSLAPVAIQNASTNWTIAFIVLITVIIVNIFGKGIIKLIPVIIGLSVGYVVSLIMGVVDLTPIYNAKWLAMPQIAFPKFNPAAIAIIAPAAIAPLVEHVGDILAIGATVEEDFIKDPGIHKTMFADGTSTIISAFLGGPPKTTYSENTGVLALTKVWKPQVMWIAAIVAILLSFVQKLSVAISTIPNAVIGGISIVLFGMIASIGVRTVVENDIDFTDSRNLIIASVVLVLGIGGAMIKIGNSFEIGGMGLAAIVGVVLNQILPKNKNKYEETALSNK